MAGKCQLLGWIDLLCLWEPKSLLPLSLVEVTVTAAAQGAEVRPRCVPSTGTQPVLLSGTPQSSFDPARQ